MGYASLALGVRGATGSQYPPSLHLHVLVHLWKHCGVVIIQLMRINFRRGSSFEKIFIFYIKKPTKNVRQNGEVEGVVVIEVEVEFVGQEVIIY